MSTTVTENSFPLHVSIGGWNNLYTLLNNRFGTMYHPLIKNYEKLAVSTIKIKNKLTFLKRCKSYNIIPPCISIKNTLEPQHLFENFFAKTRRQLLSRAIHSCYIQLKKNDDSTTQFLADINQQYTDLAFTIIDFVNTRCSQINKKCKENHLKKLNWLKKKTEVKSHTSRTDLNTPTPPISSSPAPPILNLSDRQLTSSEDFALSRGLNFSIPSDTKTEIIETAATIEQWLSISSLEDGIKHEIRRDSKLALVKHVKKPKLKQDNTVKIIKTLKLDPSIVILKADKGNQTVIMNKEDYENKMSTVIEVGHYQKVKHNPTSGYEKKVKLLLKKLLSSNAIDKNVHDYLNPNHTHPPILYGLPKTHKKDMPMRPVVDYRRTPCYKISKYAANIINDCGRDNLCTVQNSADFVNKISSFQLEENHKFVSFDVKSLFPSIPIQDALRIIKEDLEADDRWKLKFGGSLDDLMNILELCLTTSYFTFREQFYVQRSGCPMGSPLSPIIAEFYMRRLETSIVPHIEQIHFWARYVDDIFAIIEKDTELPIRDILDSFHPDIQFTHESEENEQLPFLDALIYRRNNDMIGHKAYRKPTHTEIYLNYFSNHHYSHKLSVVHALYIRAFRVCDLISLDDELSHVTNVLVNNNYPTWLLQKEKKRLYSTFINNNYHWPKKSSTLPTQNSQVEIEYVCLPFTRSTSQHIANSIKKHIFGSNVDVKISFSPGPKLSSIFSFHKDKFPLNCGVYEAKCLSCISVYVGETGQPLKLRIYQHLNAIRNDDSTRSATVTHIQESNYTHKIDSSSFRLIKPEDRPWKRKFMESLYIKKYEEFYPLMNQEDGMLLDPIWPSFLKNFL